MNPTKPVLHVRLLTDVHFFRRLQQTFVDHVPCPVPGQLLPGPSEEIRPIDLRPILGVIVPGTMRTVRTAGQVLAEAGSCSARRRLSSGYSRRTCGRPRARHRRQPSTRPSSVRSRKRATSPGSARSTAGSSLLASSITPAPEPQLRLAFSLVPRGRCWKILARAVSFGDDIRAAPPGEAG